jgi:hypothetical protein
MSFWVPCVGSFVSPDHGPMTLEWIAPTATAVVGLAGIAATWLTARASRIDQRNMMLAQHSRESEGALRETRRNAYSAFLADLYRVFYSTSFVGFSAYTYEKDADVINDLFRSMAILHIIGSDVVRQLADQIIPQIFFWRGERIDNPGLEETAYKKTTESIKDSLYILERLMANDLGIPLNAPPEIEEAVKHVKTLEDVNQILAHQQNQNTSQTAHRPPES